MFYVAGTGLGISYVNILRQEYTYDVGIVITILRMSTWKMTEVKKVAQKAQKLEPILSDTSVFLTMDMKKGRGA